MEYENLLRIKTLLEEFGALSGLVCNVEKTSLLPIGLPMQIDERIRDIGFNIADNITVLGLEIDKDGAMQSNFTNIQRKISKQISSWRQFNLSLPGRIGIAKSLLYSQINYLGCFLPIPDDYVSNLGLVNNGLCKRKTKHCQEKIVPKPGRGGSWSF
jgi:hypothetical protein